MLSESGSVVARRFTGRIVESALLVLAVALGVGAASAGFSLLANAVASGKAMLASPSYTELVVSTRSSADEMTVPAVKRPAQANVSLTTADLDAAGVVPSIAYAYVENRDNLEFVNAASVQREQDMQAAFQQQFQGESVSAQGSGGRTTVLVQGRSSGAAQASAGGPDGPPGFRRVTADDLKKAQAQADIVIVDGIDHMNGYEVTAQYFDAWKIKAAVGSLFTSSDAAQGSGTNLVLGSAAAEKIAASVSKKPADLVGKKILTREGYDTVVGVAAPTGDATLDQSYFSAYHVPNFGPGGPPPFLRFNTSLRFSVSDPTKLAQADDLLTSWFASKKGEGQVAIANPRTQAQRIIDRNAGIGLLILILSAAGLFIALVNVSHILASRGMRMRKNVGIMMALGASRSSVLRLFAAEGTFVAAIGSILGGVFALPLSRSMESALGLSAASWLYVLLGVLIAWLLTMAFSLVPAWQNSRVVPADAMRAA
jgi:hypothetical protein